MKAQLLVCDEVRYDAAEKCHVLGKVRNAISVPTLPYVIDVTVFIKLFDFPREKELVQFVTFEHGYDLLGRTEFSVVRNYRKPDQVPGVDTFSPVSIVVCYTGIHYLRLYVDGEENAIYPLTIRLDEDGAVGQ